MNQIQYLAEKWLATQDDVVLDELAREFRPRIEALTRMFDQNHKEDLVQHVLLDLRRSLELYNPETKVQFTTYFHHRAIGRMRNYTRDHVNTIRISRHTYDFVQKVQKSVSKFTAEHVSYPTTEDTAKSLSCTPEYVEQKCAQARQPLSFNRFSDEIVSPYTEENLIESLYQSTLVAELVKNVSEGKPLDYLFDGDKVQARKAASLVRKYIKENL